MSWLCMSSGLKCGYLIYCMVDYYSVGQAVLAHHLYVDIHVWPQFLSLSGPIRDLPQEGLVVL